MSSFLGLTAARSRQAGNRSSSPDGNVDAAAGILAELRVLRGRRRMIRTRCWMVPRLEIQSIGISQCGVPVICSPGVQLRDQAEMEVSFRLSLLCVMAAAA